MRSNDKDAEPNDNEEAPEETAREPETPEIEQEDADWTFADVMAMPDPEERTAKKTFVLKGKPWTVTIRADGGESAETFNTLVAELAKAAEYIRENQVFKANTLSGKVVIKSAGYLGQLYVLAEVMVKPKQCLDELILWGHKIGKDFNKVLDWAMRENGVTEYLVEQMMERAKKNGRADPTTKDSEKPSSTTASPTFTPYRKPRLKAPARPSSSSSSPTTRK